MNNSQEIRNLISALLKEKNITANKMLSDINFNVSFLTDMQRKGNMPASDKLGIIADYLDVSIDYLMGRTDNPQSHK